MNTPLNNKFNSRNGYVQWQKHGVLHREDGPAIEYGDGDEEWWMNGKQHREDGPALNRHGRKEWWLNGKLHREGAPAVEWADGQQEWWVDGVRQKLMPTQKDVTLWKLIKGFLGW